MCPNHILSSSPSPHHHCLGNLKTFSDIFAAGLRDEKNSRRGLVKSCFHCFQSTLAKCQPQVLSEYNIIKSSSKSHHDTMNKDQDQMTKLSKSKSLNLFKFHFHCLPAVNATSMSIHHNYSSFWRLEKRC